MTITRTIGEHVPPVDPFAGHRETMRQLAKRAETFRAVRLALRVETLDGDPLMAETDTLASPEMINDLVAALEPHLSKVVPHG